MLDLLQALLDLASVWGTTALVVLAVVAVAASWRLWRSEPTLSTGARLKRVGTGWWAVGFILAIVGIYLLNVQLAPLTRGLATLQAGKNETVPDISFRRVSDDAPHRLRDFRGQVVVLNLWATWCPPCLEEMPTLDRLQASYGDRGVVVIALSDEPREHLRSFFEKRPTAHLLSAYADSLGWLEIADFRPLTLVIDRAGVLRRHLLGARGYEELEAGIRPHLQAGALAGDR